MAPLGLEVGGAFLGGPVAELKALQLDRALSTRLPPRVFSDLFRGPPPLGWYSLVLPQELTSILPDVAVYLGAFDMAHGGPLYEILAQRGGEYYDLPFSMVHLLQDAHVGFAPADTQSVLLAAVAFGWLLGNVRELERALYTARDSVSALLAGRGQLTPSVTLDSMRLDRSLIIFIDSAGTDTLQFTRPRIFGRTPSTGFTPRIQLNAFELGDGGVFLYVEWISGRYGLSAEFGRPDWEQLRNP